MLQVLVAWMPAKAAPTSQTGSDARGMCQQHTACLLECGLEYSVASSRQGLDRVLGKLANPNSKASAVDVVEQACTLPCILEAPSLTLKGVRAKNLVFQHAGYFCASETSSELSIFLKMVQECR